MWTAISMSWYRPTKLYNWPQGEIQLHGGSQSTSSLYRRHWYTQNRSGFFNTVLHWRTTEKLDNKKGNKCIHMIQQELISMKISCILGVVILRMQSILPWAQCCIEEIRGGQARARTRTACPYLPIYLILIALSVLTNHLPVITAD